MAIRLSTSKITRYFLFYCTIYSKPATIKMKRDGFCIRERTVFYDFVLFDQSLRAAYNVDAGGQPNGGAIAVNIAADKLSGESVDANLGCG